MKKAMLTVVATTSEGKDVLAGVYQFYETYGLPFDVILELIDDHGCAVDWRAFFQDARRAGKKSESTMLMVDSACSDVYGARTIDGVKAMDWIRPRLAILAKEAP